MVRPISLRFEDDGGVRKVRPAAHLVRAAAAHVRSADERGSSPENIARKLFGRSDEPTMLLLRAATGPATTTGSGWADAIAQHAIRDFIASVTSLSAGASKGALAAHRKKLAAFSALGGRFLRFPLDDRSEPNARER